VRWHRQHGEVASLRDLLQRYRPVGTPGAAARPGVPADRAAEVATELEPVLALLADTEDDVRRLHEQTREEARRIREQAAREADDLLAAAHERTSEVRARAAADARAAAAPDGELLVEAARENARCVRKRAAALMPEYVGRAVDVALSTVHTDEVVR
jgi:peptidoglycan hydrolase CwlO-like protein